MLGVSEIRNMQMRDAFISKLYEKVKHDKDIIIISNDYGAVSLDKFRNDFPDQYINAGVSEQNIISMAAGMAIAGKKVFVYSIASFIVTRCLEQIKIDICSQQLPIKIIAVGAGYAYSEDGPTHHACEDIAIMRTLDGMQIYSPSNAVMTSNLVDISLDTSMPMYIRMDKGIYSNFKEDINYDLGLDVDSLGNDLCIISTGTIHNVAIDLSRILFENGIRSTVVDIFRLKPLNTKLLSKILEDHTHVVTIEEHTLNGGLSSIVAEHILDNALNCALKRFGIVEGGIYVYGVREEVRKKLGLDARDMSTSVAEWLK